MVWKDVDTMWFLPSALNVKMEKFNKARVNGGSNYDSLKLSYRWRTQRNAIRNATCGFRETSKFWTHLALQGNLEHASLSIVTTNLGCDLITCNREAEPVSGGQTFAKEPVLLSWLAHVVESVLWLLNWLMLDNWPLWSFSASGLEWSFKGCLVRQLLTKRKHQNISNAISDEARLPAEFKHIIKRRKRN